MQCHYFESEIYDHDMFTALFIDAQQLYSEISKTRRVAFHRDADEFHVGEFTWSKFRFNSCCTPTPADNVLVSAVLIHAKEIYGYFVNIASDDDWDGESWRTARNLYELVFQEEAVCPFIM